MSVFSEGELLPIFTFLGGGLALAVLMFVLAGRLRRAAGRNVSDALASLDVSKLERATRQMVGGASGLRFAYRGQRALLDFAAPRISPQAALAPRSFGGLDEGNLGVTRIRFWLVPPASQQTLSELMAPGIEGCWSAPARAELERLRLLRLEGLGVCVKREGLFLMKAGWLTGEQLQCFVDSSTQLVGMHLDGTLFDKE